MSHHRLTALLACAAAAAAAEPLRDATAHAEGAFIARTGIDRAWTTTTLGGSYDTSLIDGADLNRTRFDGRWTRGPLSITGAAQVRVRSNPDGGGTESGFGDCEAGASYALPLSPVMRLVGGVDAVLNTAGDDALGGGANVLRPYAVLALLARQRTSVAVEFGYAFDAGTEDGVDDIGLADLRLTGIGALAKDVFAFARIVPAYDTEDDDFAFEVAGGVGVVSGEHHTVRIETVQPLDGESRDERGWTLRAAYAWAF